MPAVEVVRSTRTWRTPGVVHELAVSGMLKIWRSPTVPIVNVEDTLVLPRVFQVELELTIRVLTCQTDVPLLDVATTEICNVAVETWEI
jgi:hypothetical protein